jgi:PAS domain S-box-containing protein
MESDAGRRGIPARIWIAAGAIAAGALGLVQRRRAGETTRARQELHDLRRLHLAVEAGGLGTWHWNLADGHVQWDRRLEEIYGLEPGSFDGTMATYRGLLHPEDRQFVADAIAEGMRTTRPWRFDHRVVWPDGSVHWLEGRGEPLYDDSGEMIGAIGVTSNVDARHARLAVETRAREHAEQSSAAVHRLADIATALAGAMTVDEVGAVIVERVVDALQARSGYFAILDDYANELVMRAQSGYPDWIARRWSRTALHEQVPGAEAVRTGQTIFIESHEHRNEAFPHFRADPMHAAFVVFPLRSIDETRAVLAFGFEEPRQFDAHEQAYMSAVIELCTQGLQRAVAFEAEQAARTQLRTLLESSEELGALDDPERVAETITSIASTRIGTWAALVRARNDGGFQRSVVSHRDPEVADMLLPVLERLARGDRSIAHVINSGEPRLFNGLTEAAQKIIADDDDLAALVDRIGIGSCLMVPITIAGRRLAILAIGDERPAGLRLSDVDLASDLGRRGASALERAQLWQQSRRQLAAEHRTVEVLQRTLVPERLPALRNIRLGAAYKPADVEIDVGGDWYDAFMCPDGSLFVVVADVAGHGIQAASFMGRVRNALRAYAVVNSDPGTVLERLHTLVCMQDASEMVTAFVARINPITYDMAWSRAGHPPPVLLTPDGDPAFLEEVNGPPLGTVEVRYPVARTTLAPRSLLVLYTDGLIERRDCVLDDGFRWLANRVREQARVELDTLCTDLVEHSFVPFPAPDDVCVLALRTR